MTEPRFALEPVRYERVPDYRGMILALAFTLMGIAFALGFLFGG